MSKMEKIRKWLTRIAVGLAIFIPIFFMAAPLGYKMGSWDLMTSFGLLTKKGPILLKVAAAVAAIALVISVWSNHKKSILLSALALMVPLSGLVYQNTLKTQRQGIPPIHDISTDTQDPPAFTTVILELRGDDSNPVDYVGKTFGKEGKLVAAAQFKAYPEVRTIILSDTAETAYEKSLSVIEAMGWKLQSQSAATGIIEATETTRWFGFKDDIVIRIRPAEGAGSLVDIRSVSRIGRSDIGANAARITEFSQRMLD